MRRVVTLAAAVAAMMVLQGPAEAAFGYRKIFTVQPGQVTGGPILDFPVLVSLTDPDLRSVANLGRVETGSDLSFRGEDATTCGGPSPCTLDFEIEHYDSTNGTLVAWVRVPSIDNGTQIHLYYGDDTITCSQQNRAGIWDPTYREVFHLGETGDYADSTSNGFTAVPIGSVTQEAAGKVGFAAQFAGPAESRIIASDGQQIGNTSFTLEAWVSFASLQAGLYTGIVTKGRESGLAGVGLGDWIGIYKDGTADRLAMGWECCNPPSKPSNLVDATTVIAVGPWYHLVAVYDGATGQRSLYVNAGAPAIDTVNFAQYASIPQFLRIGDDSNGRFHNGIIDEVRLAKDARPFGWIKTSYDNQNAPATFWTVTDVAPAAVTGAACPADNPCHGGPGSCHLRSIGTRADYGTAAAVGAGTQVSVTSGSRVVTGTGGTQWAINNRGRGDRITINSVDYTVTAVDSDTRLRLTAPFAAASGTYDYTIARKFKGTVTSPLIDWENCIDGPASGPGCEGISSSSLVADNRSEIGIVYVDGASYTFPVAGQEILTINGSVTDAAHTITLTADPGNRHLGITGAGVVLDNAANTTTPIRLQDEFVTLEWIELEGGTGAGVHGIDFVPSTGTNGFVCRNNLIHDISGQAVRVTGVSPFTAVADIYNNIIFGGGREGIEIGDTLLAGSRVRILNNTLYRNNTSGSAQQIRSSDATGTNPFVLLRNNVFVADGFAPDTNVPWPNVGSSHNITGDAAPPPAPCDPGPPPAGTCNQSDIGPNPRGGGLYSETEAALDFLSAGTDFHIGDSSVARDVGASLGSVFQTDVDGATRLAPWDVGADEFGGLAAVGVGCAIGTYPTGTNLVDHGTFDLGKAGTGGGPAGNNFTTSATYNDWDCPGDTESTIRISTGLCAGTSVWLSQFPGDPAAGLAATPNSLYGNGNSTGGPYILWRQTVTGLQASTTYTFFLYASNANNGPVTQPTDLTALRFCKGVIGAGPYDCSTRLNAADFLVPNETPATGDYWRRYQVTFTTGPAETSADLAVLDAATGSFGDDVQVTQLGVQACTTTAVDLMSFAATAADSAVSLAWRTGSELDNLGFQLYRGPSFGGPWTRITRSLIPGLGSSPEGAEYSWLDTGLVNGVRYFYRLEDIDTASVATFHGPISAVPRPSPGPVPGGRGATDPEAVPESGAPGGGSTPTDPGVPGSLEPAPECPTCPRTYGDPGSASFRVLSRSASGMVVELVTPGFVAISDSAGVRVSVPGFDEPSDPTAPALPLKRALLNGVVGRSARVVSADAGDVVSFPDLTPAAVGEPLMDIAADGTVRPLRSSVALDTSSGAVLPLESVAVTSSAFLGETKKLALEMNPLRYDTASGELLLTRILTVQIAFDGALTAFETGSGSRGRRVPRSLRRGSPDVLAYLQTTEEGLYAVSFDSLFPARQRPIPMSSLKLSLAGDPVPFHVEPLSRLFRSGSQIVFFAPQVASSTDFSGELSYVLERGRGGTFMRTTSAAPAGDPVSLSPLASEVFETNRIYQAGLLQAPDIWLWEGAAGGASRTVFFLLAGVDLLSPLQARIKVSLQGASDSGTADEHHVSVTLNGTSLGDRSFAGKLPYVFEETVDVSVLLEGENTLTLTNLGDTGVYSLVFLDRAEVVFPRRPQLRGGRLEGELTEGGVVTVSGAATLAVDVTDPLTPVWLSGMESVGGSVRLQTEAGHRYVVASLEGLRSPRIAPPLRSGLRDPANQADYVLIAPKALLDAAQPLLQRREDQGLSTLAASLEEIAAGFGHGRPSARAIRDFLAYAFHSWQAPSLKYVVLLGDASYDPRNFTGRDQGAPLPAHWTKTLYMWTASDPTLAAVNGDDALPDIALGRLPATTVEEAEALVEKVLDWEDSGQGLGGAAILVADNPDEAGDFEADLEDIRTSFLSGRPTQTLKVGALGANTRPQILSAFDAGASFMTFVGHGGAAVWASENVLNSWDTPSLLAQSQQPLMLTMNCLNGYFVAPNYDALAEAFLKVEGRGTIAAFSPSGLSLDGPAHQYHRAVMDEVVNGGHERLGDAILAAQATYAGTGLMPELLGIYHLLGDPGMTIQ